MSDHELDIGHGVTISRTVDKHGEWVGLIRRHPSASGPGTCASAVAFDTPASRAVHGYGIGVSRRRRERTAHSQPVAALQRVRAPRLHPRRPMGARVKIGRRGGRGFEPALSPAGEPTASPTDSGGIRHGALSLPHPRRSATACGVTVTDLDASRPVAAIGGLLPTPKPTPGYDADAVTDAERDCINWNLSGAVRRARAAKPTR